MASPAHRAPHRFRRPLRAPLPPPPPRLPTPSLYSRRPSAHQVSQLRTIVPRPSRRRHAIQVVTAFDDDPGDFSLVHDDGDEQFGVPQYSSESEWSDDDVILTAFTDVELPMAVKSRAEGALTIAAHRFATIDKGHKKSSFISTCWIPFCTSR